LFSIFVFIWVIGELRELCAKFWKFWIKIDREIICQSWLLLTPFFNFPIVHCMTVMLCMHSCTHVNVKIWIFRGVTLPWEFLSSDARNMSLQQICVGSRLRKTRVPSRPQLRILLAPTGALIVIVCYYWSVAGNFFRFWAFLPILQ